MPPGATLAPPDEATQKSQAHAAAGIHKTIPLDAEAERRPLVVGTPRAHAWLNDALLENSDTRPKSLVKDTFFSFFLHALIICTALLIPLYFTEAIDLRAFSQTMLVAPPPPPPPPPPAAPAIVKAVRAPTRVFQVAGKLIAPTVIPSQVAMLKEKPEDLPPDAGAGYGVAGGVPGGVPGGQIGGVIGGIIGGTPRTMTPNAPPPPAARAPIRVGGRVSPPRQLVSPNPIYPPLAKQARIEGDVLIDAVIDAQGNVVEMQVLSGHPLLIPNAIAALRQWKYQPTVLNEEAVPVKLIVTIRFRLNQ